ncbi:hypothetical protein C7T94_05270 [Pedobacter yulinensis]|uniref:Uncharacterized protein n=1 Tax=Pedobacter yulinensis TaxID=2126353 RepID=A0A2T3HNW0_9SPHI|nr:hypothetical protein C7T94_05270 [Pedobacter yulinensis]
MRESCVQAVRKKKYAARASSDILGNLNIGNCSGFRSQAIKGIKNSFIGKPFMLVYADVWVEAAG